MPHIERVTAVDLGAPDLPAELIVASDDGPLVLLIHDTPKELRDGGNRFIADVLHAQGLSTLSLSLTTAAEESGERLMPPLSETLARIDAALGWIGDQPSVRGRRLGLLSLQASADVCLSLAARRHAHLQSMVLHVEHVDPLLSPRLSGARVATLFVVPRSDLRQIADARAVMRFIAAPTSLEFVQGLARSSAAAGRREAVAHQASRWFARTFTTNAGVAAAQAG